MAKFLVIGTMAWDRVIRLEKSLIVGARIHAQNALSADGEVLDGRLGGAAANAAAALINAGNEVAVFAGLPLDQIGDRILKDGARLGLDLTLVRRIPVPRALTLILVTPEGERTIIGVSPNPKHDHANWRAALMECEPLSFPDLARVAPDGVYLRAALPGSACLSRIEDTRIVAQWPLPDQLTDIPVEVFIASADDLGSELNPAKLIERATEISGDHFRGFVVTEGAEGGGVYTPENTFRYASPRVDQRDATGAGDSFAAGLLEALVAGADLREAVDHGAEWGAIAASHGGCLQDYRPALFPSYSLQPLA